MRRTGYRPEEARLLQVHAQMHMRKGETALARERLQEALAIFQRLGACKDIERVEQQLADLAHSPV